MRQYDPISFPKLFDHTGLANDAGRDYFEKLCLEAREYGFQMVAVNSAQTCLCKQLLKDTGVHVGAAISFPLGETTLETKLFETKDAILCGADEIDYVVKLTAVKDGNWDYIRTEMEAIVSLCREHGVISKVIFETCLLSKDEIAKLAAIAKEVKPDYIKTSTGKAGGGATAEDVRLMKSIAGPEVKVKASGGIRTLHDVLTMLEAGAERIGCSSSVKIMHEFEAYLQEHRLDAIVIDDNG